MNRIVLAFAILSFLGASTIAQTAENKTLTLTVDQLKSIVQAEVQLELAKRAAHVALAPVEMQISVQSSSKTPAKNDAHAIVK